MKEPPPAERILAAGPESGEKQHGQRHGGFHGPNPKRRRSALAPPLGPGALPPTIRMTNYQSQQNASLLRKAPGIVAGATKWRL